MLYCLKGIWMHHYTVTWAKLAPYLECQGYLRRGQYGYLRRENLRLDCNGGLNGNCNGNELYRDGEIKGKIDGLQGALEAFWYIP